MDQVSKARASYDAEVKNVALAEQALKDAAASIGNVWAAFLDISEMPESIKPYAVILDDASAKRDAAYAAIPSIWATA